MTAPKPIPEVMVRFFDANHLLSLATAAFDDLWAATVFYRFDERRQWLLFHTKETTGHGRLASLNGRVAGTITSQAHGVGDIQGIQLIGEARRLDGQGATDAKTHFALHLPDVGFVDEPIWALQPFYVKFVDNTRGFGHTDEWYL